jgi:hypothetical protein
MKKREEQKAAGFDVLATAAQAIGSTLGKIAVKTGIAKAAPPVVKKQAAPKAVRAAVPAKRKTPIRKAAAKTATRAKKTR